MPGEKNEAERTADHRSMGQSRGGMLRPTANHVTSRIESETIRCSRRTRPPLGAFIDQPKLRFVRRSRSVKQIGQFPVQPRFLPSSGKMVIDTRLGAVKVLRA